MIFGIKGKSIILTHTILLSRSCCGKDAGTRGEVNKQSFNEEHRIHYHIDELTDKDSGKNSGLMNT